MKEEFKEEMKENIEVSDDKPREIVVPGEVIASGANFLPGENAKREDNDIIATRFGLLDKEGRFVKVIPLSGIYLPRTGNTVIGIVDEITFNGWLIDIGSPYKAFLSTSECQGFIAKREDLSAIFNFGDLLTAKVIGVKAKGVDLTIRDRGLHKLENGITIKINSSKVPRVIGKLGSMVNLIKTETNCNIVVGQNGIVWIRGDNVESELLAKEAILFITEKSFVHGLTDMVKEFLDNKKLK